MLQDHALFGLRLRRSMSVRMFACWKLLQIDSCVSNCVLFFSFLNILTIFGCISSPLKTGFVSKYEDKVESGSSQLIVRGNKSQTNSYNCYYSHYFINH